MPIPTARPLSRRPSGFLAAFLLCLGLLVAPAVQAAMPDAEFVQLCVEGDLAAVRRALQEGANPNAADDTGTIRYEGDKASNALICAASKSHLDLVNLLLAAGADPNAANKRGGTALMAANDDVRVAQTLLAAGADPNAVNKLGETPLFYQAGADDPARVAELLAAGAEVNAVNKRGETALMQALAPYVHDSHPEVVKVLLEAGADPNAVDHNGATTLMWAMGQWWHTKDSDDIVVRNVQLLLAAGAEVNAVDKHGGTALMAATDAGSVEAVKTLLAAGADVNRATSAQSGQVYPFMRSQIWSAGCTALWLAVYGGNMDMVKTLLAAGANPNVEADTVGQSGITALTLAIMEDENDTGEMAKTLLAAGAEVNAVDKHGETALMVASSYGRYTNARVLRAAGADESIRNPFGKTAADMEKWKKNILRYVLFIVLPAVLGALLAVLALRCFIARFNPSWWLRDGRRNWWTFCWLCLGLWPLMAVLVAFIILCIVLYFVLTSTDFGMV